MYASDYFNKSIFGQAWSVAHEPNAYPVPTIYKACCGEHHMLDELYDLHRPLIDERINQIPRDGRPIIPLKKIGEGHSQMSTRSPRLFAYLRKRLDEIKYPFTKIDYCGHVYPVYSAS